MSRNDLKQTFLHRDSEEKLMIEQLINDRIVRNNSTKSGEGIAALKRGLFPSHPDAAHQVEFLYRHIYTLNEAVGNTFNRMGEGINWEPLYNNAMPLIEFAAAQNRRNGNSIRRTGADIHYLKKNWEIVIQGLKNYADNDAYFNKPNVERDILEAEKLLDELKNDPLDVVLSNLYDIIIRNWIALRDWQITYRALYGLAIVGVEWRQTADARLQLIEILSDMSIDWLKQDKEKRQERSAQFAPKPMREIAMKDAHVIVPENWVVINPDDALNSEYAYAVAIRTNDYIDAKLGHIPIPFFVYFSNNSIQREIYDDCMSRAEAMWPPLKAIMTAHIDFPEDALENEQIVNDVIGDSPNAAPFLIDDANKKYCRYPYGAMVIRHKK
ncbi:MAG: hypothetical protein IJH64_02905 [Oscillospiraceae bacterium]|nr:hypothetical protein [Oscillospiraceae bacterium]